MNVLLIGSGGREHALAWKLAQSPMLDKLFAAPGNPGIAECADIVELDVGESGAAARFCKTHQVALVVVGPEAPLVAGLADQLRAEGIAVFGPGREAARLEGSKAFTKFLCRRKSIPTAGFAHVSDEKAALDALAGFGLPVVVKADGLAAGKGVTVAQTRAEAEQAIAALFAEAGAEAVIEEHLEGEEASLFVMTDGRTILPFGSAQDHKRVGEGDTGPNTGGMGAYSPAPILTPELERRAIEEIVRPTIEALAETGTPYSGILYAGLMLTKDGPKLIEYNARFGDPECQVLMLRLESDLLPLMLAAAEGSLDEAEPPAFSLNVALTVVMAAKGYPGTPEKGGRIEGIEEAGAGVKVFHAGTACGADGALVANGGRVLDVTALGHDIAEARAIAYRAVDAICFPSGFWRSDIGWRELARSG
jgi:phosphoribosylamine--glycine ligase